MLLRRLLGDYVDRRRSPWSDDVRRKDCDSGTTSESDEDEGREEFEVPLACWGLGNNLVSQTVGNRIYIRSHGTSSNTILGFSKYQTCRCGFLDALGWSQFTGARGLGWVRDEIPSAATTAPALWWAQMSITRRFD